MKQFIDKLKGNNDVSEFLKVSEDGFSVNPASLGFTENLQKVKYDEDKKNMAREKWKSYKSNGFIIKTHKAD